MSVLIRKILLGLLLSFITLPALAENTILVLGDSLSAAYGLKPEQGWTALLQKRLQKNLLPYRVANDSVSGDTTSNGLVRLPFALVNNHPVITIIELGANDGLRGLSLDEVRRNLKAMIAMCKSAHSRVILVGIQLPPNYGPEYTAKFQALYKELTAENNISLVPSLLAGIESDRKLFQEDGLHPVALAQHQMLDNVWVVLKPLLK